MAGIWPDNIHCVAIITFDVDGVSSWLRRNAEFANYPSLLSMAEYGPRVASYNSRCIPPARRGDARLSSWSDRRISCSIITCCAPPL